MRRQRLQFGILPAAILAASLFAGSAFAQRRMVVPRPRPVAPRLQSPAQRERNAQDLPQGALDRLQQMTPEQQEKWLNNNDKFRKLPPERQAQIRQNLRAWNNLTPQQRQTLLQRQRVFEQLTPEQQRYVRQTLLPEWQNLPPERQRVLLQKLGDLRDLGDSQRADKLNDESFMNGLNPQERQVLRDMASLRVGSVPIE